MILTVGNAGRLPRQQQIFGLEVAVDDALVVHEADGVAHVRQDGRRFIFAQRAPLNDVVEQWPPPVNNSVTRCNLFSSTTASSRLTTWGCRHLFNARTSERELVGDAGRLEARGGDDFGREDLARRFLGGFVDRARRAGADLRAEVVERGEGRFRHACSTNGEPWTIAM